MALNGKKEILKQFLSGELSRTRAAALLSSYKLRANGHRVEPVYYYEPVWVPKSVDRNGTAGEVLTVHGALTADDVSTLRGSPAPRIMLVSPDTYMGPSLALLDLAKSIVALELSAPVEIGVVGQCQPNYEAVVGLARTIALEHPLMSCRSIYIESENEPDEIIRQELAIPCEPGSEVRYAKEGRLVREFHRIHPSREGASAFRETGVYVITGGAGGLGRILARHLGPHEKAQIVLIGRSAADAVSCADLPPNCHYLSADVTRREQMESAIAMVRNQFGAIHGIIHAAGITEDAALISKDRSSFERVLAPKITGAVVLDEITAGLPDLDFFVLCSSLTAVTGNIGQGDYAAANRFLDAFASWREGMRSAGLRFGRSLSIAWPLWAEGGMKPSALVAEFLRDAGVAPLSTAAGLRAFDRALAHPSAQVVITTKPLETLTRPIRRPMEETATSGDRELEERASQYLVKAIAEAVRLPAATIRPDAPFTTYGVDSILVLHLTSRLERDFGPLSKTLFFEYGSVALLSRYFAVQHRDRLVQITNGAAPIKPAPPLRSTPQSELVPRRVERAVYGTADADIAVIGISGRFPMAAEWRQFWSNLVAGRDCITEIPSDRWPLEGFYDAEKGKPGKSYSKWGGFIDGVDRFSPLFFHISPREAYMMDPQERLFLETAWGCVEDAGYTPATVTASKKRDVGVFVGVMYGSYQLLAVEEAMKGNPVIAGSWYYSVANRVSYCFDFRGPSMAIDTACSSSLAAIHMACEQLRLGNCSAAIAGGVNVTIHPNKYHQLSFGHFASSDGRCRSFGEGGDGYVPGEGVAAVLLKPLDDAIAEGAHIYGVIKGSAVNHGGRTTGYSVPNPACQAALIEEALERAHVEPGTISYVEAHGTGTALGDPIELEGLTRAFANVGHGQPCALGSVKSNIGHLEAAAGVAALIKVLLQMRYGKLAPSLHAERINTNISFERTPFHLVRELTDWSPPALPRRAGISSFGAGGANVHLIVEEFAEAPRESLPPQRHLIPLSARTREELQRAAHNLSVVLRDEESRLELEDVAFTLAVGREAMEHRLAVLAGSIAELTAGLDHFSAGVPDPSVVTGTTSAEDLLGGGPEALEFLRSLAANGSLDRVAKLWVSGATVPFEKTVLSGGKRKPLPTYPFEGKRYWVKQVEKPSDLHPFLDAMVPSVDGLVFRKVFRPSDGLLAGHRVNGKPVLPGVAVLEMVRAAADLSGSGNVRTIRDVTWLRPVAVTTEAEIQLRLFRKDGRVAFELTSDAGLHCRGAVSFEEGTRSAAEMVDIEHVKRTCQREIEPAELYAALERAGLQYGDEFQTISALRCGEGRSLAALEPRSGLVLNPYWMDAAFQATAALAGDEKGLRVPAAVASIEITQRGVVPAWAMAVVAGDGFDVTLLDKDGCHAVTFRGLRFLAARPTTSSVAVQGSHSGGFYALRWRMLEEEAAPEDLAFAGHALIVKPADDFGVADILVDLHKGRATVTDYVTPEQYEGLLAGLPGLDAVYFLGALQDEQRPWSRVAYEQSRQNLMAALTMVQALRRSGRSRDLRLFAVGSHGHPVVPGDVVLPGAGSVFAFCKAVAQEYPGIRVTSIDIPRVSLSRERLSSAVRSQAADVAVRDGMVFSRNIEALDLGGATAGPLPLRRNGIYLLFGGAGGIGLAVADYLARTCAARLVLVGRREAQGALFTRLEELKKNGADVVYCQADITDVDAVHRVREQALERYGVIHGVIHTAIVLDDRALENMDAKAFSTAYDVKALGCMALDEVFGNDALDFLLFFSSGGSLTGSRGQANYIAGCGFKDAYAMYLRHTRGMPARVINWGYWSETGIVSQPEYRERLERQGVFGFRTEEGVAAFEQFLAHDLDQALVIKLHPEAARRIGVRQTRTLRLAANASVPGMREAVEAVVPGEVAGLSIDSDELITDLRELVASHMPAVTRGLPNVSRVLPQYRRLYEGLANTVAIPLAGNRPVLSGSPHAALLNRCVEHLGRVMTGEMAATEALFPKSSTELVEAIYKNDPVGKAYNQLLAGAVRAAMEKAANSDGGSLRILEIGAGTGSASERVLDAIAPYAGRLQYVYSDLSPKFVQYGKAQFGVKYPFCKFTLFDIEREIERQQIEPASFDIVLASHVLHATRRIAHTLNQTKKLLKAGGLLLLNETTSVETFATLTFGLLDGWWLFEDAVRRLPASPLLDRRGWEISLAEAGFRGMRSYSLIRSTAQNGFSQHVLIAESDGFVSFEETAEKPKTAFPEAVNIRKTITPQSDRFRFIEDAISDAVIQSFQLSSDELDKTKRFADFGADSIVSLELLDRVNSALGLNLKTPVLFDYSSVTDLAAYIYQTESGATKPANGTARAVPAANGAPATGDGAELKQILTALAEGRVRYEDAIALGPAEL
jgi:acyl transferase domain-containing protein/SAM-dependent methyltransferase/acyl carrier protein